MLKKISILFLYALLAACGQSSTDSGAGKQPDSGSGSDPAGSGNFYAGKNINYIVTTNAGGGYDAYARLIGRYMADMLGAENAIVNNIPGGGHIVGSNTLWKSRPDGLTVGTFNAGLIYNQLIGVKTLQFDIGKFSWIGKAAGEARSLVVSEDCEIQSMEELLAADQVIKFASAGVGSASYIDTKLLAEAFELNIEIIPGFEGNEGEMSMMRGEVCGQFGTTSSIQPFVDSGYGHFILTVGGQVEGVPNAMEFAETDKAKGIVTLIGALAELGRVTAAPPGVDPERLQQLRNAYYETLNNPDFLAEAERMNMPIDPAYGDEVTQLVLNALDQSPETIQIIANAVRVE